MGGRTSAGASARRAGRAPAEEAARLPQRAVPVAVGGNHVDGEPERMLAVDVVAARGEAGGDGQAEAVDEVEHVVDDARVAAHVGAGHRRQPAAGEGRRGERPCSRLRWRRGSARPWRGPRRRTSRRGCRRRSRGGSRRGARGAQIAARPPGSRRRGRRRRGARRRCRRCRRSPRRCRRRRSRGCRRRCRAAWGPRLRRS